MCGINGLHIGNKPKIEIRNLLKKMNQKIIHRGPDEEGYFYEDNIGMSMTRLSIIDLKTGAQPIYSEDKNIVIVFNGEIYNFISLRNHLKEKGIHFKTTSDTEVVLKLYEVYGVESFSMLDGMYAFSIYDKKKKQLLIARDFFGEKPLYYTQNNNGFYWASELKSIITVIEQNKNISKKGLNLFLKLTYIPAPYTIYQNIYKLEANSYITFNTISSEFSITKIHQKKKIETNQNIDFNSAKNKIHQLVNQSIESRSIADVEIGTFLSGGVDSSIVSLVLSQQSSLPVNTFSVGFKKKSFDETDKARTIAKLIGSKHHEFIIDESDLEGNLSEILLNFDEPFADSSALASYIVANKTAKYLKVALTGDGGDEVFGGYNKYYIGKINKNYTKYIPEKLHRLINKSFQPLLNQKEDKRGLLFKINKLLTAIDYNHAFYWHIISLGFQNQNDILLSRYQHNNIFSLYNDTINISKIDTLTDFRNVDRLISLEGDMLAKVDRTAMLTSLETRAPFLNKQIWDYTMELPENFLLKGNNKKYILKEAFKGYFPNDFLEKSKMGFGVPVGDWLRTSLKSELLSYIDVSFLDKQNIFNQGEIIKLVQNHLSNKIDNSFKVWTYFVFQKWYKNNCL